MVTTFFLDTSAIVKRYKVETGTIWLQTLIDPVAKNKLILSEITLAEVAAAISAAYRASDGLTQQQRDGALDLFLKHCLTEYNLIATDRAVIDQAVDLTQNHKLRGCDAIQLAAALTVNNALLVNGIPTPFIFVAADNDLLIAAQAEGLMTENPNHYP